MLRIKDGFNGERALAQTQPIVKQMEQGPLISMLHITYICYYPKAEHHFRERCEPINQFVYIYSKKG